jgi:hypothetical protein
LALEATLLHPSHDRGLVTAAGDQASPNGDRGFELMEIATAETLVGETELLREKFLQALGSLGRATLNQSLVPKAPRRQPATRRRMTARR